jgi:sigma-B regulation protein RsbU (phosphoserine phosphatase)
MDPAKAVGGDFYDFFLIDNDHLCLVMADVSGKGIPAALFMMATKIIVASCAMLGKSAAEILTQTNEAICSNNREEMFVTIWVGILEISTGKLTAANGGHEYPILKQAGGRFELIKDKHGLAIGAIDGVQYKQYELLLEPGSKLFVYTDGVPEATDKDYKMFGTDRLLTVLNENPDSSPEQILDRVGCAIDDFVKDAEQFDDQTMLCIEYRGSEDKSMEEQTMPLTVMNSELEVDALTENLARVQAFVDEHLEEAGCPFKVQMQIGIAVEEIFINIASYAYAPGVGKATIRVEITKDPSAVNIIFIDRGIPYNPLTKEDPDVTLSAEERDIGGLGIYMAKEIMDAEHYEYKDGQNILTLTKYLQ